MSRRTSKRQPTAEKAVKPKGTVVKKAKTSLSQSQVDELLGDL